MEDFNHYLEQIGEIGFIEELVHSLVYSSGLPKAHANELVVFETGDMGQVFSLDKEHVEILLFSNAGLRVGNKVARAGQSLQVPVGTGLLGRSINPLGVPLDSKAKLVDVRPSPIDIEPPKIMARRQVDKPLTTGVTIVDLVVPLARGQRQLVIGDRKTGKTEFLLQTIMDQAKLGTICIYAVIGQKQTDIKRLSEFLEKSKIIQNSVIVASSSSSSAGLIYLTPYTAMAIAEAFRDAGKDVLLILDDMTTHAKTYREISLLAKRFPGRSSYPGDIFYIHARLFERAGNFRKGSITLLPVSESLLGDLSGYIQTNLMAMTDGHIFFDIDLYNQGKRPAVNPFLSVTRVGHQTRTVLQRDVGRELLSFLVTYEKMKQFLHFGAEVGDFARNVLTLGERIDAFFNQKPEVTIPINANILILSSLWAGLWSQTKMDELDRQIEKVILAYETEEQFKNEIDQLILKTTNFSDLVTSLRRNKEIVTKKL